MVYVALVFLIVVICLGGFGIGWVLGRQSGRAEAAARRASAQEEMEAVFDRALDLVRHERTESLQAAVDGVLSLASSKLGDQLAAGRMTIERERDTVTGQVENVHNELRRVSGLVAELQKERAAQHGELANLADTTRLLQRALASPGSRGQWGERMASDVLRAAGFAEGVNFHRHRKLPGGSVPDFTFPLPKGHVVHMDVKFPLDNYLRWLEAGSDDERARCARAFQRDVRQRVKELAGRDYIDPGTTVDELLLFVPNESVYGFLHEHDPGLLDEAIAQRVVLCSPTTLFAVLAVIRQAIDNFSFEKRSNEILASVAALREQWDRWAEPVEKMGRGLRSAQKAFDDLAGPRTRQFERQLAKLEAVRDDRRAEPTGPCDGDPPELARADDAGADGTALLDRVV
jgi:DNA recombination protein RmuC